MIKMENSIICTQVPNFCCFSDKLKRTALTHAVMNGNSTVASYLLYLGADPNRADSSGNTMAHYAAGYGWHSCLKMLLDAGADPKRPNDWMVRSICSICSILVGTLFDSSGNTVVHFAAGYGWHFCLKMLE